MPTDIEQFLKLLFGLWVTANQNKKINRITESNLRECIQFEQSNDGINLKTLSINNQQISVLFCDKDNYLVIKLEDNIYLAITVCQELSNNVLKITGKDFSNNREQEGLKTEYLIRLIESIGGCIDGKKKVDRLRRKLFNKLTEETFRQEEAPNGQNQYFKFTFKLINELTNDQEIEKIITHYKSVLTGNEPPINGDPEPTDRFYQQRQDREQAEGVTIEQSCQKILQEAGQRTILIRVKGARYMGKNSFVKYLLAHNDLLKKDQAQKVKIDLENCIDTFRNEPNNFYQYLCQKIMSQLDLPLPENMSVQNNLFCTNFFEQNIVSKIENPLFLVIENLHKIFPYIQQIDFLNLLRSWQNKYDATISNTHGWSKLIFILTYSTNDYPENNIKNSPLWNCPEGKQLGEYNREEVIKLVKKYELIFDDNEITKLINTVGGHPFLISKALDTIKKTGIDLDNFINSALTMYENHLLELYNTLNEPNNLELKENFRRVVDSTELVQLDPLSVFHLYSIGLVKKDNLYPTQVTIRCELYRQYFSQNL